MDKSTIVVVGGFWMHENMNANVHVEYLTIRQPKMHGVLVYGESSFTTNDIIIEQCGVVAGSSSTVARYVLLL